MRLLSQEVSIVCPLVFVGNTSLNDILIQVCQAIAGRLAKGPEIVLVWRVDEKIRDVVRRSDSDIVCAEKAFSVTVALVCRLQREHFILV